MDLETAQTNATVKLPLLKQENGNSFKPTARTTTNADGTSTSMIPSPVTTKEKAQKKNDVKARSVLLMALPNEHQLTFNQYKDVKTLFDAVQTRFGVVWRNKSDLDTMSIDDLYNNFKIVEQEVKRTVTSSSNSNSSSQNMAFVTTDTLDSTANLSDAIVYAFLANQPNGSQLVHEDLEQIHEDDLKEMVVSFTKGPRNQDNRNSNQDSSRRTVNVEETSSKATVAIDGASNMFYLSDFKEFDGGYVTFEAGARGGRINSKGTLKTGKLDFEDVYFVKEL
ncbi:hypothetical protein Tco_0801478, partial [Tanacetum coccineum]